MTVATPSPRNTNAIAERLGEVLASTYTLYLKTQNFHWNIEGPRFMTLHEMFGAQYQEMVPAIDEIAERIRTFGVKAPGSYAEFSARTKVRDAPAAAPDENGMIAELLADHETLSRLCSDLRRDADEIGDTATGDVMNGRIQVHDKTAWMLRAHRG
jgi:starvation-inducible DNA-binding protein